MLQYRYSLDSAFAALADPTRRGIVARLCDREMSVGELAEPLEMSLSAVGQHLRLLEEAGLVETEKRGRKRFCRVSVERLSAVEAWMTERRRKIEGRLDRLQEHLSSRGNHHEF